MGNRVMKKYFIITYGCQMNRSDSERIANVLENMDLKLAKKMNDADLILVNMCSVRQSAVDRVYGLFPKFQKFKKENSKLKTVLTGCILKKDRMQFAKRFDWILDINNLLYWPKILKIRDGGQVKKNYFKILPKYQTRFSALVPIMTGCDNFCAYCVVPYTRGKEISRSAKGIIQEIKKLIKGDYKEIWLLGQNVNSYRDGLINFPKLLKAVNDIRGNFWIRFTSPHPKDFSEELVRVMAKCQKVTPYLNLPVQSGDNKILKKMNRPYTISHYKNLIKKIRAAFKRYRRGLEKEVSISTDVIIGFPGEREKQFKNTVKLFKEIKYDMAYIARYSPRPGTVAEKLKDNVPPPEKERRYKILTKILKETAQDQNKKYLGREIEVLVNEIKNQSLIGKSRHYKTVKIPIDSECRAQKTNLIGQFVKVKIIDISPWGLKGVLKK